jgi:hypothetical protein
MLKKEEKRRNDCILIAMKIAKLGAEVGELFHCCTSAWALQEKLWSCRL